MMNLKNMKLGVYAARAYGATLGPVYRWLKGHSRTHGTASRTKVPTLAELCLYNTLSKDTDIKRKEL